VITLLVTALLLAGWVAGVGVAVRVWNRLDK